MLLYDLYVHLCTLTRDYNYLKEWKSFLTAADAFQQSDLYSWSVNCFLNQAFQQENCQGLCVPVARRCMWDIILSSWHIQIQSVAFELAVFSELQCGGDKHEEESYAGEMTSVKFAPHPVSVPLLLLYLPVYKRFVTFSSLLAFSFLQALS
jgi:hypothetical protein